MLAECFLSLGGFHLCYNEVSLVIERMHSVAM